MNDSFLTRHLKDADERYFEHLAFTLKAGGTLVAAGIVIVIHGFFPFILTHTGSRMLDHLNAELAQRRKACEEKGRCKAENRPNSPN